MVDHVASTTGSAVRAVRHPGGATPAPNRAAAVLLGVGNIPATSAPRTLWVSQVPRDALEALSAALARGPLDSHFFLTLEAGFHRTALAFPMAEALVDDALPGLLPAQLPPAQRAAWRSCLIHLLVLPREAWEVECMALRAQLCGSVAARVRLLGVVRDALYRPFDLPRADWNALLERQRAVQSRDSREVALGLQRGSCAARLERARMQLREMLPGVADTHVAHALARATALAGPESGLLDPRTALPFLFDVVLEDGRPLIDQRQRSAVLQQLAQQAGDEGAPLLRTGGGPGDALAMRLLSVARRACLDGAPLPGMRQLLADAMLRVATWPAELLAWQARPAAGEVKEARPSAAPNAAPLGAAAVAPVERLGGAPTANAVSAAGRPAGNHLLALAGGLVGGGLGLAALGWHWMLQPPALEPAPASAEMDAVIALLDTVVAVDSDGTVWQSLWQRVHAMRGEDAAQLAEAVYASLLGNELAHEVLALLASHVAPEDPLEVRGRIRRSLSSTPALPGAGDAMEGLSPDQRNALHAASLRLALAAQHAPPPAVGHAALPVGDDGTTQALIRLRMQTWLQSMGDNAAAQHARLTEAWRDIGFSEQALNGVHASLPQLDAYLAKAVAADIQRVTGQTVDPFQVHLNTFAHSETWPEWEARQLRAPGAIYRNMHHHVAPDKRVRSELVSTHTLVGAALLPPETDEVYSALYYRGIPETYFPVQECANLTLPQFNRAVAGRDYLDEFAQHYHALVATEAGRQMAAIKARFVNALSRRLSGAAMLLAASGRLHATASYLVATILRFPARLDPRDLAQSRVLAMPGHAIDVHALAADISGQAPIPLHGVLLVSAAPSADHPQPLTLLLSPARSPLLETFVSTGAALQRLQTEAAQRLSSWVPVGQHAHWQRGTPPIVLSGTIEGDFRAALFDQDLQLRSAQLCSRPGVPAAERRRAFGALERELAQLHLPVPVEVLAAAAELVARPVDELARNVDVHWLARPPAEARGVLRNVDLSDARALHALAAGRSLLDARYPQLVPFIERRLDEEILRRYGVVVDSRRCFVVAFSGGRASDQASNGWVHGRTQRLHATGFAECAMTRAEGITRRETPWVGLYTEPDSAVFDEHNEVDGLQVGQLFSLVDDLDLQREYLAALDQFWQTQEREVLGVQRGSCLFACWQQYAEGSLSLRGMQLALAVSGGLDLSQAQDPARGSPPINGTRVGWLQIHGMASTVLHIADDAGPEVLLYYARDRRPFHEFANVQDMMGWMERAMATDVGREWMESAFDLADLQDGWFSNGVHSSLGGGRQAIFGQARVSAPIVGDPWQALVQRLRDRSRRDATTLMTSRWEAFRHRWMRRLERFDQVVGLASLFLPELLPVVAVGSALELGLGVEQAIDGDSRQERQAGAAGAGTALLGLALSAPLGTARMARLAARDGARLQPVVQAAWEGGVDPLDEVAERYAQSVSLAGARAADNGIHAHQGRQYIQQAGHTYEVFFDRAYGTWRLRQPRSSGAYHHPVRLNANGLWEPHSDVGLRGGAPGTVGVQEVARRASLERSYRGALNLHLERAGAQVPDSTALDFRWGQDHWQRVVAPELLRDNTSIERMKELFVSGGIGPVQQGALSVIIERLETTLRAERYALLGATMHEAIDAAGGRFNPASQALLGQGAASAAPGMCTGLSRIMAVALGQNEELNVLEHLRLAIREPDHATAILVRSLVRDAQGIALQRGVMSSTSLISTTQLAGFLARSPVNSQFILSGTRHSMVCAVRGAINGRREFLLYDPNFGLMSFTREDHFQQWLDTLFTQRCFRDLLSTGSEPAAESLAELYGAFSTPGGSPCQFHLRQVHTARLLEQAAARDWNVLFEQVH